MAWYYRDLLYAGLLAGAGWLLGKFVDAGERWCPPDEDEA